MKVIVLIVPQIIALVIAILSILISFDEKKNIKDILKDKYIVLLVCLLFLSCFYSIGSAIHNTNKNKRELSDAEEKRKELFRTILSLHDNVQKINFIKEEALESVRNLTFLLNKSEDENNIVSIDNPRFHNSNKIDIVLLRQALKERDLLITYNVTRTKIEVINRLNAYNLMLIPSSEGGLNQCLFSIYYRKEISREILKIALRVLDLAGVDIEQLSLVEGEFEENNDILKHKFPSSEEFIKQYLRDSAITSLPLVPLDSIKKDLTLNITSIPDTYAQVNALYKYILTVEGSEEDIIFKLIKKPSWLKIQSVKNTALLSGIPDKIGEVVVEIEVSRNDGTEPIIQEFIIDISNRNYEVEPLSINVYPNPVRDSVVNIALNKYVIEPIEVWVYGMDGKVKLNKSYTNEATLKLNVLNLKSGIYILKLRIGDQIFTKKLLKT